MRQAILFDDSSIKDAELALQDFSNHGVADQIHVAGDGQEALDFLQTHTARSETQPAIGLLDVSLPVVSGLELLKIIRRDRHYR